MDRGDEGVPPELRGPGAWNYVLRFLLELGVMTAVAIWAVATFSGILGWVLAVVGIVLVGAFWVTFVNPRGRLVPGDPGRLALEVLVFSGGAALLAIAGSIPAGLVYAAVAAIHLSFTFVYRQRELPRRGRSADRRGQ